MTAPYLPPVTVTAKRPSAIERALALLVAQQDATQQPNTPSGGQRLAAAIGGSTGFLDALERMKQPPIGPLEDSPRSRNAMLDAAVMGLQGGAGLTTRPVVHTTTEMPLTSRHVFDLGDWHTNVVADREPSGARQGLSGLLNSIAIEMRDSEKYGQQMSWRDALDMLRGDFAKQVTSRAEKQLTQYARNGGRYVP